MEVIPRRMLLMSKATTEEAERAAVERFRDMPVD